MAKGKGLEKVYVCSEELAEIINCETTTRPQMTKKIWAYIKKHDLQDPHKKRVIIPDHKLSGVLGHKPIDMFKMTSKLSEHLFDE